jgi:hypothetical protein
MGISFGVTNGTEPLTGVYFRYQFGTDGNFWTAVTASAGVRTATITAIPVVASAFLNYKIVVNRSWTSARFYIN